MKFASCFILTTLLSLQSFAGNFTGNGGDHVRGVFLKLGQAVVDYLKETQEGKQLLEKNHLNIKDIEKNLSIEIISTVDELLTDNRGSSVDALGTKGKITLQKSRWTDHFEKERDVYYLVFHELLRALEVNDDNYVISKVLLPFPKSRMLNTRINPIFPLLDSERLDRVFDVDKILITGTGCPLSQLGTHVDFDKESNQLNISFDEYNLEVKSNLNQTNDRKSCNLSIPAKLPPRTRLVVTQVDMMSTIDLPNSSALSFGAEVFFAGEKNTPFQKTVRGLAKRQRGRSLLRENLVLKSNCNFSGVFRTNSSAWLSSNNAKDNSSAEISNFRMSFKLETCE